MFDALFGVGRVDVWWNGGEGQFPVKSTVLEGISSTTFMHPIDMDNDLDIGAKLTKEGRSVGCLTFVLSLPPDFILGTQIGTVAWLTNDGSGVFTPNIISQAEDSVRVATAGDFHQQGSPSIAVASLGAHPVTVFRNAACKGVCPAGQYSTGICIRRDDDAGAACRQCSVASQCGADEWLDNCGPAPSEGPGTCRPCSTSASCPTGSYQTTACSDFADRVCSPCNATACAAGQHLSGCGGTSPGACVGCAPDACDLSVEYLFGCGGTHGGQCVACNAAECPSGFWLSALCEDSADRECTPCCGGDVGTWSPDCGGSSPGTCQACSATGCLTGQFLDGCRSANSGTCRDCRPEEDACTDTSTFVARTCSGLQAWACRAKSELLPASVAVAAGGAATFPASALDLQGHTALLDVNLDGVGPDVLVASPLDRGAFVALKRSATDAAWHPFQKVGFGDVGAVTAALLLDADLDGVEDDVVVFANDNTTVHWFNQSHGATANPATLIDLSVFPLFRDIDGFFDACRTTVGATTGFAAGVLSPGADAAGSVVWYSARDGGDWGERGILGPSGGATALACADVNLDGVTDVVVSSASTAGSSASVRWYAGHDDGPESPLFSTFGTTVADGAVGVRGLAAGDLDTDGDVDIVAVLLDAGTVEFYENTGTGGSFRLSITTVAPVMDGGAAVTVADVDGDGFLE